MTEEDADIKTHLAIEATRITSGSRRGAYGKPENNFGRIATMWAAWFKIRGISLQRENEHMQWKDYELSAGDISPLMRLMKEARLAETPDHYDSHVDLFGYTQTGAEVVGVQRPVKDDTTALQATINDLQRANAGLEAELRAMRLRQSTAASLDQVLASSRAAHQASAAVPDPNAPQSPAP